MKRPEANLPSLAQPWGRWAEMSIDAAKGAMKRLLQGESDVSNVALSATSNIASRVRRIGIRRTEIFPIPDYTRNFAAVPFGTTIRTIADSNIIFINAPANGLATIVVNCESDTENSAKIILRVNGVDVGNSSDFRYSSSIRAAYGNSIISGAIKAELLMGPNSIQVGVDSGVALPIPTSASISNMIIAVSYQES